MHFSLDSLKMHMSKRETKGKEAPFYMIRLSSCIIILTLGIYLDTFTIYLSDKQEALYKLYQLYSIILVSHGFELGNYSHLGQKKKKKRERHLLNATR